MAHHPNGHGTYGQHDPSHPQQTYQPYSPTAHSFDHQIRRTSSFDAGDDQAYGNAPRGGQQYVSSDAGATSYGSGNQDYRYEQIGGSYQQNLPMRGASYRSAQTGYQQPYQPATTSPELHHYNPQQYSQPPPQQSQYIPYNATTTPTTYTHQTYNPAAYQPSPELQRQATFTSPYTSPFNRQSSFSQGPPVPPRPNASYSAHPTPNVSAYTSTTSPLPQHPGSAPLPPRPSTYSPPVPSFPQRDTRLSNPQYNSNHEQQAYPSSSGAGHGSYENAYHTPSDYQSPPGYTAFDDRPSFSARMNTMNARVSPPVRLAPSSSASPDTSRSPQRTDTLTRHPQARPLPGPPPESDSDSDYFNSAGRPQPPSSGDLSYDDLMKEIETAIDRPPPRPRGSSSQQAQDFRAPSRQNTGIVTPTSGNFDITPDERYTHTHPNGHLEAVGSGQYINYGAFSDDSEAEAAAGLAAMQADDEREAAEQARRRSGGNASSLFDSHGSPAAITPDYTRPAEHSSSDSEYKVDMGLVGGGYDAHLHYDDNFHTTTEMAYETFLPRMSSMKSSDRSTDGRTSQTDSYVPMPTPDFGRPLPPVHAEVARVDTSGTGGLTEPSPYPRRMSFDDGDEAALLENDHDIHRTPSNNSPVKDSMPDLFYHPGMSPHRPLPPAPAEAQERIPHLIPAGTYQHNMLPPIQSQLEPKNQYPATADAFDVGGSSSVPRSTSFASTRSAPKVEQPIRSKTDADKAKLLRAVTSSRESTFGSPQTTIGYDLPVLKKSFNPEKITQAQFKKCTEPWALSSVVQWLKYLVADADYLKEGALTHAIVSLCTFKVPTMNTTEAEKLGSKVVKDMFQAGVLLKEEEWVKLGPGELSGVLFQLTGTGCYSPRLHITEGGGKCYSYHCMRTWKRVDLTQQMPQERKVEDWVTFYKLKKEDLDGKDKKEIERQNILHEIVTTEDGFMSQIDVLRLLYRDQLQATQIIPAKRISSFVNDVFGPIDEVKKVNEDYLLGQLKYRQQDEGPWIVGFSDIFREWIRKAKAIYINYASGFPRADYLVRHEASHNIAFRMFLDQAREDKRSNRLSWDSYLKGPITRLQRYGLLLQTVHKNMIGDSEEKLNLQYAIDEVRAVTFECNAKVDEMTKKIELLELSQKLKLRKGMEKVELNLDHLGREIIIQGDLLRAGGRGLQWVETRAILFDHYLVLAKIDSAKDSAGGLKYERYDVSKMPIPMDLIVLESINDDPVVKSSVKGLGAVTSTVSSRPQLSTTGTGSTRGTSTSGPASIHTNITDTSSKSETSIPSSRSMITTTILDPGTKDDKIMYPFRVKHLGNPEVYTLYAPSASNRQEWCEAIIAAKTNHALALQQQNAEPFKLKVLADTAFGFDGSASGPRPVMIRGTPLDLAIREAEQKYAGQPRPGPVCRAAVNCATVFNQPYGRLICAVGTDYGVFISEYDNPRGWARSVQMTRVTQVTALEEFSLFLLISDKSLIAYPLDTVCSASANLVPVQNDSTRRAPQKLSGTREVGFFASGKMKDRGLVFYKKKDGISSTFKVLEPVLQKAATSRSRFLPSSSRRGQTEFFREYDEFYIPAECYSLNLFHSSLAISTSRGVEVLTLDKKVPFSVPILRAEQPETQARLSSIASRIKDLKPLGMFRLAESEFLVAFEECAVYVDKYGDVSRSVVMEFVGRAKSACLFGQYLILFNDDFLEIRNSMNGRMKQVITGRDIKCLDDGGGGNTGSPSVPSLGGGLNGLGVQGFGAAPRTVKFCMQHPEFERCQLIVELLENDVRQDEFGQKDF